LFLVLCWASSLALEPLLPPWVRHSERRIDNRIHHHVLESFQRRRLHQDPISPRNLIEIPIIWTHLTV
jgi:hypothetical protein